jgi:hypothetical protein
MDFSDLLEESTIRNAPRRSTIAGTKKCELKDFLKLPYGGLYAMTKARVERHQAHAIL